ncbi:MAG: hypothetical protein GY947_10825 [Rhodobacteraceae bacterium]|nr:hypothetical protein [Paracoccaceae bacterium]
MPPWHPEEENLLRLEGAVETVEIRDDISNTTAGAMWPMLTSVYFTLEGHRGEFRYPYSHPDYFLVRDNTSGALEVWVNESEIGTGVPMTIWQIQEHSSYNYLYPETSIKFETIFALRDKVGTSWRRLAIWLLLAGGGLTATGYLMRRWNQHRGARSQV